MPRGGHRGGIFPVSGLPWGPNGRYLKRGLYHQKREDIFTPRWGYAFSNSNPSPLPDGGAKKFDVDVRKAWLQPVATRQQNALYARNEARYLMAASRCTDTAAREYILNMLEESRGYRSHSGIGLPDVMVNSPSAASTDEPSSRRRRTEAAPLSPLTPRFLLSVAAEEEEDGDHNSGDDALPRPVSSRNSSSRAPASRRRGNPSILEAGQALQRGRIRRLWKLVLESSLWRWPLSSSAAASAAASGSASSSPLGHGAFPYVDETASLVRDLPLAEILYSRSNHRLKCRRHPFWLNLRFKKLETKVPYLHRRKLTRRALRSRELGVWGS